MRSLAALGRRTLSPLPFAGNVATVVQIVGFLVVIFGGATILGFSVGPAEAVAAAAILLLVLFANAAWSLQRELDRRIASHFDCAPNFERVDWRFRGDHGEVWEHEAVAWVEVRNLGPTSRFAAQVHDVTGVPEFWGSPYRVTEPTWDGKHSAVTEIPRGGERRIKLASVMRDPRGMWFWTSELGREGPGRQWWLGEGESASVEFIVEVVNIGDADQAVRKRGRLTVPLNAHDAEFTL
jgi:hypothetical protein